jgi:predicted Zn-dependent protease
MESKSGHAQIIEIDDYRKRVISEFRDNMNQLANEFPNQHKSKKSKAYKAYEAQYKAKELLIISAYRNELTRIGNEVRKIIYEIAVKLS